MQPATIDHPQRQAGLPAHHILWLLVILLAGLSEAFFCYRQVRREPIRFDEAAYCMAATDIQRDGVISKYLFSNIRTYIYPAFVAVTAKDVALRNDQTRRSIFIVQTFLYFASVIVLYFVWQRYLGVTKALAVLALFCLNPIFLVYLSYILTEIFSLLLTLAFVTLVACSLRENHIPKWWHSVLLGLILGAAIMTRPANIYLMTLWLPGVCLHLWRAYRAGSLTRAITMSAISLLILTAICVPQYINNSRYWHRKTPLVANDLGGNVIHWGRLYVKYATYWGPKGDPRLRYTNPFFASLPDHPTLAQRSWAEVRSDAVHVFALVDQDFIRTYTYSLTPSTRWLGTIGSLSLFMIGSFGILVSSAFGAAELWQSRFIQVGRTNILAVASLIALLGCVALYARTSVEARYGLPILAFSSLFLPSAITSWSRLRLTLRLASAAIFCVLLLSGCVLSHWVQAQAPSIVQAWKLQGRQ
ncbi:MAG TPA: glycosyltransferase family 39 protein [Chthoniobacterales bacterium]